MLHAISILITIFCLCVYVIGNKYIDISCNVLIAQGADYIQFPSILQILGQIS
jgi:hypothetical protein